MNRKQLLFAGSLMAALSFGAGATTHANTGSNDHGYCTIPHLHATNIRSTCEQFGSKGIETLYSGSRMFEQLLSRPQIADVLADPDLRRPRS